MTASDPAPDLDLDPSELGEDGSDELDAELRDEDDAQAPGGPARLRATQEALARAREHGRRAAAEAALALRALLDAGSLSLLGADPTRHGGMAGRLADLLDELARRLAGESPPGDRLVDAIASALEAEIARWEERASEDPEARAVLRAYLGLRELLWELGVRRRTRRSANERSPAQRALDVRPERAPAPSRGPQRGGRRMQRVPVEG